jgi:hypothetical protein
MDLVDLKEDIIPMKNYLNLPSNGHFVAICSTVGDEAKLFLKNERV